MPSHRVHLEVDRWYLGRTYPRIHKVMDRPVKIYGRRHRILFHDIPWAIHIANSEYPGDFLAEKSACLHLEYDKLCSRDKDSKKFFERWAKKQVLNRKKAKRLKKQLLKKLEITSKKKKASAKIL